MTATLGPIPLNWQHLQAGFQLTVIQARERARYLGAMDQGHAGQLLDLGRGRGRAQLGFEGGWEMTRYLNVFSGFSIKPHDEFGPFSLGDNPCQNL